MRTGRTGESRKGTVLTCRRRPRRQGKRPCLIGMAVAAMVSVSSNRPLRAAPNAVRRVRSSGHAAPLPFVRDPTRGRPQTPQQEPEAWCTRSLADLDVLGLYLDALALRVRSAGKVVSVPAFGVGRGSHRRAEATPGPGALPRGRDLRSLEGVLGQSGRPRAHGAGVVRDRRAPRAAQGGRPRVAPGPGPTLLRPQAAEPRAQGAEARPGGDPSRLPPDRLHRERGRNPRRLRGLRAEMGIAVSGRGPPACRRAARSCSPSSSSRSVTTANGSMTHYALTPGSHRRARPYLGIP
jgi:hypothetical protein